MKAQRRFMRACRVFVQAKAGDWQEKARARKRLARAEWAMLERFGGTRALAAIMKISAHVAREAGR